MSELQVKKSDPICEFIQGERDCKEGLPAKINASKNYNRGYAYRYAMDEMKSKGVI